jgi:hypothetical protein
LIKPTVDIETVPCGPEGRNEGKHANVEEANAQAKRTGLGSLMKSAKKNVTSTEFDIGAFGF